MDSDDDDIYPENDVDDSHRGQKEVKMQDFDDGEEEGEEVESDSDDDINFITDAKEETKPETTSQTKSKSGPHENEARKTSITPGPSIKRELTPQANIHRLGTPQDDGRPGTDFPARHTSSLDPINGNPIHPTTGKPILNTDFDTDFPSESTKPWRKPGSDITDYFNYGFDEFTWASYCLKKQQMPQEVKQINQEAEQMKAFVEGIGTGSMPGMPTMPGNGAAPAAAMPQMPGMPSEQEMQQMLQAMMAQGMDPSSMDSNQFMSMMMGGGGPNPGQFQQAQQPPTGPSGYGGGNYQDNFTGGGGGGRGRGRGGRRNW